MIPGVGSNGPTPDFCSGGCTNGDEIDSTLSMSRTARNFFIVAARPVDDKIKIEDLIAKHIEAIGAAEVRRDRAPS
jgi:hypothetical protein